MTSIEVRNARENELRAAVEVLNEHSRRLYGTDDTTPAELQKAWHAPEIEFPADVFVAESDGELIGYADVIPHGESAWLDVRGIDPVAYGPLLSAAAERAESHRTEHVRGWAPEHDSPLHEAYEQAGFRPFRHSFRMEIDLDGELPKPAWPEGSAVRTFREGDELHVHDAHMSSFADTWGFALDPFETWAHWNFGEGFEPDHWFLVEVGDDVAAIALCRVAESEPDVGWVNILGVKPDFRRRGLALALLQHVFRHFARLGLRRVGLSVDAENPTGAVRLYERAGMHVARRDVRYEKVPR